MKPKQLLPYDSSFTSVEEYVSSLLKFVTTSHLFQLFCGGVHVVDFFTHDGGLFQHIVPPDWQEFLTATPPMELLDFLMRYDLDEEKLPERSRYTVPPPASLLEYVRQIRRHALRRELVTREGTGKRRKRLPVLPRQVAIGMKPKKIHEVTNFADYVDRLAQTVDKVRIGSESDNSSTANPSYTTTISDDPSFVGNDILANAQASRSSKKKPITHLVDFGSGQNYLGRALAQPPYSRDIVAVEGRASNIDGARDLDFMAGLAEREVVMRNKKLWQQHLDAQKPASELTPKERRRLTQPRIDDKAADLRPSRELKVTYRTPEKGHGSIHYVSGHLKDGDLSAVISKLKDTLGEGISSTNEEEEGALALMGVSIHSCGNLSHHGIRSLVLNPDIKAIAIVGCCYNLTTERLGPPTYKPGTGEAFLRPSLQAVNGRVARESARHDPQGYPMSERLATYGGENGGRGARLNVTARMMACQAPYNWTAQESDEFFTRHFYRAVLQKIFLDKGVIGRVFHGQEESEAASQNNGDEQKSKASPFNTSTNPLIIGSVRKACYRSFLAYVRGAVAKLTSNRDYAKYSPVVQEKMGDITDDEIARYEEEYTGRKREVSAVWSLMAFSATVVESLMVTDRWLFLREHDDVIKDCWVEAVFDYAQSPRNLVVVGVKK